MDPTNNQLQRFSSSNSPPEPQQQEHGDSKGSRVSVMSLPMDIMMKIFGYIPAADLGSNVRLVNRKFKAIAEISLDVKFGKINPKLACLVNRVDAVARVAHDHTEVRSLSELATAAKLLQSENDNIKSTVWRYAFSNLFTSTRIQTCMYGGLILDEQERFIRSFAVEDNQLQSIAVSRQQMLPEQIKNIESLIKKFCQHCDRLAENFSKN